MAMLIKSVSSPGTFYNMGIPTFRLKNKLVNILAFHEKLNSAADVVIFRLLNIIIPMTPKHRICLFVLNVTTSAAEFSFS